MSKKKLLIIGVVGVTLCLMLGVAVLIWRLITQGEQHLLSSLPVYTTEQVASSHPGYRHTLLTSGSAIYVNDYEEAPLQLINPEPTGVVGRTAFGGGKICAIPGHKPADYLAADCGSEMPAYEVFRSTGTPPFDWRHATFQKMQLAISMGPAANKQTTDAALIQDVIRTLIEGTPATIPAVVLTNLSAVQLYSDQLPGMIYAPSLYIDPKGNVYLAESIAMEDYKALKVQARWIPASPAFTKWAQTP